MSQNENKKVQSAALDEAGVADYLEKNPDFFIRHKPLLEVMSVPHETGRAISLIERQTSLLRDRNQKLATNLTDFIDNARDNGYQLEKTKRMVLALLDAVTLDDVAVAVEESLCRDFCSDKTSLVLFSDNPLNVNNLRMLPRATAGVIEPLMKVVAPTCGQLSLLENRFLFEDDAVRIQSAAFVPLVKGETIGLLAVGSYDPSHFQSSQGTLFLTYVGEVLSRVTSRIMHEGPV